MVPALALVAIMRTATPMIEAAWRNRLSSLRNCFSVVNLCPLFVNVFTDLCKRGPFVRAREEPNGRIASAFLDLRKALPPPPIWIHLAFVFLMLELRWGEWNQAGTSKRYRPWSCGRRFLHSPRPKLHFQWASGTCYRAATVRERSVRQKAEYRSALPRQSPSSTRPARSLSSKDNPGVWKGIPSGISDPCDLRGRGTMDVLRMLAELRGERARLAEAIVSLEKLALLSKPRRGRPPESSRAARCHSASDPECPQRLNGWGRLVRASRLTTL